MAFFCAKQHKNTKSLTSSLLEPDPGVDVGPDSGIVAGSALGADPEAFPDELLETDAETEIASLSSKSRRLNFSSSAVPPNMVIVRLASSSRAAAFASLSPSAFIESLLLMALMLIPPPLMSPSVLFLLFFAAKDPSADDPRDPLVLDVGLDVPFRTTERWKPNTRACHHNCSKGVVHFLRCDRRIGRDNHH